MSILQRYDAMDYAAALEARGEADAPDIDGRVYVSDRLPVGAFAEVKITGFHDYDLLALPAGHQPREYKVARQAQ